MIFEKLIKAFNKINFLKFNVSNNYEYCRNSVLNGFKDINRIFRISFFSCCFYNHHNHKFQLFNIMIVTNNYIFY